MKSLRFLGAFVAATALNGCATAQKSQPAPAGFAKLVSSHAQQILDNGYAHEISDDDLYHGHLIIRENKDCYLGLEEALEHTAFILYHTEEVTSYGRDEKDWNKTPRSILGTPQKEIMPAIDFVGEQNLNFKVIYRDFGTIAPFDIITKMKENGDTNEYNAAYFCYFQSGKKRYASAQIRINSLTDIQIRPDRIKRLERKMR